MFNEDCEGLRGPSNVMLVDKRNGYFNITDIEKQHNIVSSLQLNDCVPEKIAIEFDTARNLYLYALYVYRFYSVAQHRIFTVLEAAIKQRYGLDEIKRFGKESRKGNGLAACLHYLIENKFIQNSDFGVQGDFLSSFVDYARCARNKHAHGKTLLIPHIYEDFEDVTVIINKIYQTKPAEKQT